MRITNELHEWRLRPDVGKGHDPYERRRSITVQEVERAHREPSLVFDAGHDAGLSPKQAEAFALWVLDWARRNGSDRPIFADMLKVIEWAANMPVDEEDGDFPAVDHARETLHRIRESRKGTTR